MTTMLRGPAVAVRVGVSRDTLKRWRRLTERTGIQYGPPFMRTETGVPLYSEDDIQQWIKDRMVTA